MDLHHYFDGPVLSILENRGDVIGSLLCVGNLCVMPELCDLVA